MASNLSSVLFVLSLIYICQLFVAISHTGRKVFRVGPNTEY